MKHKLYPAQRAVADFILSRVDCGDRVIPVQVPVGFGRQYIAYNISVRLRQRKATRDRKIVWLGKPWQVREYEKIKPSFVELTNDSQELNSWFCRDGKIIICFDRSCLKHNLFGLLITILSV